MKGEEFSVKGNFLTFIKRNAAVCRGRHGTEIAVKILKVASDGNHGSIVGSVAEARNENLPAVALGIVVEGVTQASVR